MFVVRAMLRSRCTLSTLLTSLHNPCKLATPDPFDYVTPAAARVEYSVRGKVVVEANAMRDAIAAAAAEGKPSPYPFESIIFCNIGNPQSVGQPSLSYICKGLSYFHCPTPAAHTPDGVQKYIEAIFPPITKGSNGQYTDSAGYAPLRDVIAKSVTKRDEAVMNGSAVPCHRDSIILSDGASSAAKLAMQAMLGVPTDAMLMPVPRYPLYSAQAPLLNCCAEGYALDPNDGWQPTVPAIAASYQAAEAQGATPRLLVVINPGNPTGSVMPWEGQEAILRFCADKGLTILADEVYQANIYGSTPFRSFRAAALTIGSPVPVISLHSASKGFIGECGRRGGYLQLHNVRPNVTATIHKLASVNLCSNVAGQVLMAMVCEPPADGPLYDTFVVERDAVMSDLRRKATMMYEELNKIPHMSCTPITGAMYAFPAMTLPPSFVEAAKATGEAPDSKWVMGLLKAAGVVVVPGSGFGMSPNGPTFYFRITILPTIPMIERAVRAIAKYHADVWNSQ